MSIKIFTAFSGYDSQCLALKYLGLDFELVGWSEIDKYAIQAHHLLFPQYKDRNFGDICKIDWNNVPDFDLFTYSFPCIDISIAGRRKGFTEESNTRSSLLWQCKKAIKVKRPKYLLMENVPALLSDKFKLSFIKWLNVLSEFGYINFVKKLNAKDFNVPQNRDRVFVVSLLDKEMFYFPKKQRLQKRLKDILEDSVNKKYYLSEKMLKYFCSVSKNGIKRGSGIITKDSLFTNTLLANQYKTSGQSILLNCSDKVMQIANLSETVSKKKSKRENPNTYRLYDFRGISPTLTTAEGSGRTPYIISYSRDAKGKVIDRHLKDTANTITTFTGRGHNTDQYALINSKIRKLTPKECFRLMGIRENEINILLSSGISDTQLYKMAGNSIVADVLMAIFYKLFINKLPDINDQINLFDYE